MNDTHLPKWLTLRMLVGFLGERAQFAWWPTSFYEPSSRPFLEPVFGKTSRLAQYHGVVEAARRLHDEHLNVGSFHLFRLPEEVEQDLHAILQNGVGEKLAAELPSSKEAALSTLKQLASGSAPAGDGPLALGSIKNLVSPSVMGAIAGTYHTAFEQNARTYPYLVD